jgi:hypothetical protein
LDDEGPEEEELARHAKGFKLKAVSTNGTAAISQELEAPFKTVVLGMIPSFTAGCLIGSIESILGSFV